MVVVSIREPLLALGEVRWRRAKRTTTTFLVVGIGEALGGMALALAADDPNWQTAGAALFVGGSVHATQGYYQRGLAHRRYDLLIEDLAAVDGKPEAWPGIADSERRSAERESRGFAFGSGMYGGLFGAGGLATFSALANGDRGAFTTSSALALVGGIGLVHHATRWRADVRIAGDLDLLEEQIPTVIPDDLGN